ncbi:MAG: type I restriction-modification system subunit M [Syntrophales bacterium]|jgi:type I restriction enzyme M protein|nr:type I restriction-modification system subunit M [Syntrophales bacterium]
MSNHQEHSNLIWQIADLLRGPYRPPQYERVMLPLTILRRFDCVLSLSKDSVLRKYEQVKDKQKDDALDSVLNKAAGQKFHNHSPLTFEKLKGDPDNIDNHLVSFINGFSANVRRIFEYFEFTTEIEKMREANILYLVISKFCEVDLHPDKVPNEEMGLIFENLIRRFNELANETAGDHFTPREVIRLMVSILFIHDDQLLATPGTVRKLLDPACGTGGMLAEAQNYLRAYHHEARLYVYGQDYNKRAYATAASDMLIKQVDHNGGGDNIRFGDSFTEDQFSDEKFDYFLTNPPFGVDWKKQQKEIQREHEKLGYGGRFGAGLPRVNDGSLLFLQHMVSKFEPVHPEQLKQGSRLAIVFSGSPLFTGGAGSGESNIRKWIIENDWLEAIIALPEQMFYNTGIGTYIWIVTNRKAEHRKGRIQLFDARNIYVPLRKNLGDKKRMIGNGEDGTPDQIHDIVKAYGTMEEWRLVEWTDKLGRRVNLKLIPPNTAAPEVPAEQNVDVNDISKVFDINEFGYTRVTVERPLRLRYQMTLDDKARFLDACPHLLDDVQAIDKALGREPLPDWNIIRQRLQDVLQECRSKWKAPELKLFRDVFTQRDPNAEPVFQGGCNEGFEPDSELRDFENIPLKDDIDEYFCREVVPHVPDAWMDRSKDKVGYEINFNRHFYRFTTPRDLNVIDADLKQAEEKIMKLLREVTS